MKRTAICNGLICIWMSVILMFGGFCTDRMTLRESVSCKDNKVSADRLAYPGAGSIFAESLPLTEHQFVAEMSSAWQIGWYVRDGRVTRVQNVIKDVVIQPGVIARLCLNGYYVPDRLHRLRTGPENAAEKNVCYIHDQDGQKG